MRLRLGTAPDSWGVWFADDPRQTTWRRFLDEVAGAGYEWVELGPYGYLPTDPVRLGDELAQRGLKAAGGTVGGNSRLHRHEQWPMTVEQTRKVAELTAALGAHQIVLLPTSYRDEISGGFVEPAELDADSWRTLVRSANELGKLVAEEYGIKLNFHEHADSHVETQAQIERFLHETDPAYVSLCLDTGHTAYRGGDSVALIRRYPERIGYVHLKQIDPRIAATAAEQGMTFGQAVKRGVCVQPPYGEPSVEAVVTALEELDRDLFVIVEQDLYPCAVDVPLPIAVRTRACLQRYGLGTPQEVFGGSS